MPPIVSWIGAQLALYAGTVGTIGTMMYIYAQVIGTVLLVAASVAYSAAQQRKLKKSLSGMGSGGGLDQGRTLMVRDPVASHRIIYGEVLVSGPLAFIHTSGTKNEYLHLVITLAAHECESLGDIYFNDEVVPLDGSGNATGTFAGYARVKKFLGIAAGERDLDLESESGGIWTSAHLGKGRARLHVRLKHNLDLFPNGMPVVKCLVKGRKVYDPRTATTAWSDNSALCTLDFLMDAVYGKGIALARIDTTEVNTAANICDESVVLDDASTEKRYTCNGTVDTAVDPNDTVLDIANSMAGHVCETGKYWTIRAGAYITPTLEFTDADIVSPVSILPRQSRQDSYNGVRGTFIGPINQYAPADFPSVKNDTYKSKDGNKRLWKDVEYNFTDSPATAQRLAKIDLEVGRQQVIVTADFSLKALQCKPGSIINLTRSKQGWTSKPFEVLKWDLKVEPGKDEAGPSLTVPMTLRETAAGVWDWADGEETVVDLAPNTALYNPRTVATPTGLVLNSVSNFVIQPDGTVIPKIKATWDSPNDEQVLNGGYTEIEYRVFGTSTWLKWTTVEGNATEDYLTDVKGGEKYDVRIRHRNVRGVRSGYQTVTEHTVATDGTAPDTPTGLTATGGPGCNVIDWSDQTEVDLDHFELYKSLSNSFPGGTPFWVGYASQHADFDVAVGVTTYYWLKSVDTSGNKSAQTASVNAAANDTTGAPGADGLNTARVTLYKRAASAPAVPSTTSTYTFATGVLTGHDNGWTQAVPAVDGNPLYATAASAAATGTTDTIATGEWATPVIMAQDGADGLNVATVTLYKRGSTAPAVPSTTSTFTFATGVLTGHDNDWYQTLPNIDTGANLYVITATAAATGTTDTIATGEWSTPQMIVTAPVGMFTFLMYGTEVAYHRGNGQLYNYLANAGFSSVEAYKGGAFASCSVPQTDKWVLVGLDSNPTASFGYADMDYCFYIFNDGTYYCVASNTILAGPTAYSANDTFQVTYDNATIKFYVNGVVVYSAAAAADQTLRLDGALLSDDAYMNNIRFGPSGSVGADGGFAEYWFKRAATIPSTPTGDTPAGWYDAPPAADGNPLWMIVGDKTAAGTLVGTWSTPVQVEGSGIEIEYSVTGSSSWHSTFTTGDLFARQRVFGGTWSAAFRIVGEQGAAGDDGADGNFFDMVYKRAASVPTTPTGNGVPSGWYRDPPTSGSDPLWMSRAEKTAADVLVGSWSTPVRITGDTGAAGSTYKLRIQLPYMGTGYVSVTVNGTGLGGATHLGSGLYEWTGLTAGEYAAIVAPASEGTWTFSSWTGDAVSVDFILNTGAATTDVMLAANLTITLN